MSDKNKPKLRLNIHDPSEDKSSNLAKAAETKRSNIETMDEAWAKILAMKNSDPDKRRLEEVKQAMAAGEIGREPEAAGKRFSKAEALRLWRVLDAMRAEQRLQDMVNNTPDNYILIDDVEAFERMLSELMSEELIVFDVETTGVDVWSDIIVGHVLTATSKDMHYYIPTGHDDPKPKLDVEWVNKRLKPLYEAEHIDKIAHNAGFDYQMLWQEGITVKGRIWDTMEAMKLLNENESSYALKPLVSKYLRDESYTYKELFGSKGFNEVPLDQALAYAAKDGDVTYRLYQFQKYHLAQHGNILEYFETVEMPLIPIVAEMELNGYVIDREFAAEYGDEIRGDVEILRNKVVEGLGEINLNSPQQLKKAIEEYIGETIDNTDAKKTLKPLSKRFDLIKTLLEYREKSKLLSTYIESLPKLIEEKTGRLHTVFNQNGARTGRFSSGGSGFNMQNQPKEARKMFVAPEGYYIVSADFSAQEVRMIASVSKEDILLEAFRNGRDPYATLGSEYYGLPYEDCFKNEDGSDTQVRKEMKVVLLQSIYGASKYGIAESLGISPDEAEKFRKNFFNKYKKIDSFIKETQRFANKNGFVWIGDKQRKRRLPEARGNMRRYDPKRNRAMRQGPNAKIQGLASIQTKATILTIDKEADKRGWKHFGPVHDEYILLIPKNAPKEDYHKLDELMTQTFKLDGVDNSTDIEIQIRWSDSISLQEYLNGKEVPSL